MKGKQDQATAFKGQWARASGSPSPFAGNLHDASLEVVQHVCKMDERSSCPAQMSLSRSNEQDWTAQEAMTRFDQPRSLRPSTNCSTHSNTTAARELNRRRHANWRGEPITVKCVRFLRTHPATVANRNLCSKKIGISIRNGSESVFDFINIRRQLRDEAHTTCPEIGFSIQQYSALYSAR